MPTWQRSQLIPLAGAALASSFVVLGIKAMGPTLLVGVAGLIVVAVLVSRPTWSLGLFCGAILFAEGEPDWGLPVSRLYDFVPGPKLSGADLLLVIATVSVALEVLRRKEVRGVDAFTPLMGLLLAAVVAGVVSGHFGGASVAIIQDQVRQLLPLMLVPLLVVQVVETPRQLRIAIALLAVMMLVKAVLGPALVFSGRTTSPTTSFVPTYLESPTNFLSVIVLATGLGAALARVRLPRWVWVTMPLTFICLVLSYRRSFWIGGSAALAMVVLLGSGRVGRRMLVPGLVVVLALGGVISSAAGGLDASGPVAQRFQTLNPTKIKTNSEDRYRLDERRSVLADLRDHPIAGLGIGVGWQQRYPLSETHVGGRQYVHTAALWWWFKLGILGLLGYVGLIVSAVAAGLKIWQRSADPVVRIAGLGVATGFIGYGLAELTASFTGAEVRENAFIGLLIGLMAVALRQSREAPLDG